ncbi:unnamed protein product [Soboliphyme baturini]|uniref:Small monomeric GTPase n=1 Tax=Soboliphyme baturini TaxID=241478 RepID=A0A183IU85_9BILA|nr:unnamed protein product [Soboliphyme baturini]
MCSENNYKLIVLGPGKTGKTSIIRRFLNNTFDERYKETVEDIYTKEFVIAGHMLLLDIYDTNYYYPDMRRILFKCASAFVFVFALDDVNSFQEVTQCIDEAKEHRPNMDQLPMVLAGNKCDINPTKVCELWFEVIQHWLSNSEIGNSLHFVETSAKANKNVREVFKTLLQVSGFPEKYCQCFAEENSSSPKRQMSCRIRAKSLKNGDKKLLNKEPSKLTRHASLMLQKSTKQVHFVPDDSDCNVS